MNKSRELFLLFCPDNIEEIVKGNVKVEGYTVVYKHYFPNDEPPYIMVTYWGIGPFKANWDMEEESIEHFLLRTSDVKSFIYSQNKAQTDYCDAYNEGIYTRNAGEHNLSAREYADGATYIRKPKVKYKFELPIISSFVSN